MTQSDRLEHLEALPAKRREVHLVQQRLSTWFAALPQREEGQSMAEYAVVLAVITIAVFAALGLLAGNIVNAISRVAGYVT